MGTIPNILDALRRLGTPMQRSAIRRQDAYLKDVEILERRRDLVRSPLGTAEVFVATTTAFPETIIPLVTPELDFIVESALNVLPFIKTFQPTVIDKWTLDNLDQAFEGWMTSEDKRGYSPRDVINVTGAAFGQYCAETLRMNWVKATDRYGTDFAVRGIEKDFRAYPFSAVAKRVDALECQSFKALYIYIESASREKDG